jgi:aminoglycoside phosphotransferase (APT) family kinase protein
MEKGELIGKGRTAEIYACGNDRVLKLYFDWCPAEWAENEAVTQRAVHSAGLPSPRLDDIIHLENRHGVVMERIAGPTMLDVLERQPWRILELARLQAEIHARVHNTHLPELEMSRLRLWGAIARTDAIPITAKQAFMKTLVGLPDGDAVCHYDLHPMNIIMSPRGPVIIDWVSAGKGNPLLDVARTWLVLTQAAWPFPFPYNVVINPLRRLFFLEYFRHYRRLHPIDREQFSVWRQITIAARLVENIPAEQKKLLAFLKLPAAEKE